MDVVLSDGPQIVTGACSIRSAQAVGYDNALHHVGQYRHPGPVLDGHGNDDGSVSAPTQRSTKPDHPGRAPKARHNHCVTAGFIAQHADGFCEFDGRCFHDISHYGSPL